jgi:hypothetical protein
MKYIILCNKNVTDKKYVLDKVLTIIEIKTLKMYGLLLSLHKFVIFHQQY